jgi:membrane-bound ClpP family serine protease
MSALRHLLFLCCLILSPLLGAADGGTAATVTDKPAAVAPPAKGPKRIAYVKIEGVIDDGKAAYYRRAIDAAVKAKVDAIVVYLNTPGGSAFSAEEISKVALAVPDDGPLTVAFVDRSSYSAGSLIAYSHKRIYLTEVATIGDIGVILRGADGKMEYGPEKIETVIRTLLRSTAQKNGWNEAKLLKMTARNQGLYRFDLKDGPQWVIEDDLPRFLAAHPEVKDEQKILLLGEDRLLSYTAKEAIAEHMATALVKDLPAVYHELGGDVSAVMDLSPSTSEELSWTLGGYAPLLAALAVLFVILELKTPGIGIWAILAGTCGVLFFICQFYLELASFPEVILVVLGLTAVLLEIFLIPTGGLLALGGVVLGMLGLILAFMPDASQFAPDSPGWGGNLLEALLRSTVAMVVAAGGVVGLILALPRLAVTRKLASTAEITATAQSDLGTAITNRAGVGSRGVARSDLAPNGYITLDGQEVSAAALNDEFIKAGTPVEVVGMRFGEAVVRPVATP